MAEKNLTVAESVDQSLCARCTHFRPALDPVIRRAFLGKCLKWEWPFTMTLPQTGYDRCDLFEDSGQTYAPPLAVAAVAAGTTDKKPVVRQLKFYYSGKIQPGEQFYCDNENALRLVEVLRHRGVDCQAIDVSDVNDMFPIYHRAVTGPAVEKRPVFGAKGALEEDFGRTVPALLVFEGDRYPSDVFPRMDRELGRVVGVEEALEGELPPHVDRAEIGEEL